MSNREIQALSDRELIRECDRMAEDIQDIKGFVKAGANHLATDLEETCIRMRALLEEQERRIHGYRNALRVLGA